MNFGNPGTVSIFTTTRQNDPILTHIFRHGLKPPTSIQYSSDEVMLFFLVGGSFFLFMSNEWEWEKSK